MISQLDIASTEGTTFVYLPCALVADWPDFPSGKQKKLLLGTKETLCKGELSLATCWLPFAVGSDTSLR